MRTMIRLAIAAALCIAAPTARAQTANTGWIEGSLLTENGQTVTLNGVYPTDIRIRGVNGKEFEARVAAEMNGYFTARDLPPGTYELFVPAAVAKVGDTLVKQRPQHHYGVVVSAGKSTRLTLTTRPGEQIEERGKAATTSEPVINLSDEVALLHKTAAEMSALRKEVELLKQQLAKARTQP